MNLKTGMIAPNFSLKNNQGKLKNNQLYLGKKLVLYFYPKDNTPGCTKESCRFRDLNSEINKLNCNIVGISADGKKSHLNFINDFNLNFELLSDVEYRMSKDFGTFFISEEFGNSINRSTFLIDESGKIINIWRNIKNPESHPDEVLNFLKSY
jgi:peroxiredoxin Q/BCP